MTKKYKSSKEVPNQVLADRLDSFVDDIINNRGMDVTMRIPAEPDRCADLVLSEAARRLRKLDSLNQWQSIETAPKYEELFIIRHKDKPHVQHEAMFFKECESWEIPNEYDVLQDMTLDEPIEDYWEDYEWQLLPKPFKTEVR